MALTSFNMYFSYLPALEMLTDAEAGSLLKGAIRYAERQTEPEFNGHERYIWPMVRTQIDRDRAAYFAKCEKNARNVSKRYESIQTDTNEYDRIRPYTNVTKDKDKVKDKDKYSNKAQSAGRFIPPTVNEIRQYCEERGNGVDAEQFHAFYSAKGWKIGKNAMKDWRACVRTWEKRIEGERAEENTAGALFITALERRRANE